MVDNDAPRVVKALRRCVKEPFPQRLVIDFMVHEKYEDDDGVISRALHPTQPRQRFRRLRRAHLLVRCDRALRVGINGSMRADECVPQPPIRDVESIPRRHEEIQRNLDWKVVLLLSGDIRVIRRTVAARAAENAHVAAAHDDVVDWSQRDGSTFAPAAAENAEQDRDAKCELIERTVETGFASDELEGLGAHRAVREEEVAHDAIRRRGGDRLASKTDVNGRSFGDWRRDDLRVEAQVVVLSFQRHVSKRREGRRYRRTLALFKLMMLTPARVLLHFAPRYAGAVRQPAREIEAPLSHRRHRAAAVCSKLVLPLILTLAP